MIFDLKDALFGASTILSGPRGYTCQKHGDLPYAVLLDHRPFCPKCVADLLQKQIGEVRVK